MSLIFVKQCICVYISDKCRKEFKPNIEIADKDKEKCLMFARNMAYGEKHNPKSFGSAEKNYIREKQEIFRDAFQGKLAEIAFYNYYVKRGFSLNKPDFSEWNRGKWEDTDFTAEFNNKEYRISIKSTKYFGNLLLLEKDRYNEQGLYIETADDQTKGVKYDLIFLVRIKGVDGSNPNVYDKKKLSAIEAEITGFITHEEFKKAIKSGKYLAKGWLINGKEKLKVDNYYFCANELKRPADG
ncbi:MULTISPECIES: hypothetical protein [unclassified Nitratiruptor]|uniref:hypothetical protein n=1 Tax=unclassified Nitratiruptor TaxID=2624044 RepID=UPI001916737B|nr:MULTISPECIES: hypothetical protein [unclassified Nitratiruptor]BCD59438.1 hypothetical protein NitYY0810_C0174 [Nitratiruptor sp. YY08-10]BCD63362.1 hypothetical protein NitYY0814_C0174 [Nitratiruptor sp. YY08-14]